MNSKFEIIVSGLLQIAEGAVIVLTLGYILPQWAGDYLYSARQKKASK
jgi:hypothetical protein